MRNIDIVAANLMILVVRFGRGWRLRLQGRRTRRVSFGRSMREGEETGMKRLFMGGPHITKAPGRNNRETKIAWRSGSVDSRL